jgi:hypothetical protein
VVETRSATGVIRRRRKARRAESAGALQVICLPPPYAPRAPTFRSLQLDRRCKVFLPTLVPWCFAVLFRCDP